MHLLFTLLYFGLNIKRLLLIETLEPKLFRHDGLYSQQGAMGSYWKLWPCIVQNVAYVILLKLFFNSLHPHVKNETFQNKTKLLQTR